MIITPIKNKNIYYPNVVKYLSYYFAVVQDMFSMTFGYKVDYYFRASLERSYDVLIVVDSPAM